jgi:hypothetical protein
VRRRFTAPRSVTVGRVNRLAKSVAVKGDAETIAELVNEKNVKAVIPSVISDILPKTY